MSDLRRFNGTQRTALFLAADGRCERCGSPLEPGWHADHVIPYSAGGVTDVVNGQALCPTCNLTKGDTLVVKPRGWQRRFIAKYHAANNTDFLCVACPGAGKTLAAGFVVKDLLDSGEVERVLVVVPSGPLRMQWHRALLKLGILLDGSTMNHPNGEMATIDARPVNGWVVTYQSLAMSPVLHRRLNTRRRTIAILDEVHHLSTLGTWGQSAIEALGVCARRLALSGTPFRSDASKMPFVEYDPDGLCQYADRIGPDGAVAIYQRGFDYSYGTALAEKPSPVRQAVFEMFDGDVAWMEFGKDDPQEARISDPMLNASTRRKTNRHALNPAGQWLNEALINADQRLSMVRDEGDRQAQGLIVCRDTEHAHEVAAVLKGIVGNGQVHVAVSRDHTGEDSTDEARATIEKFGKHGARWLVAVQMVSEGVDIPQLRVGVYATTVRAPLFFRQVLGRFVRMRDDLPEDVDQTAYLFVPKDPAMIELADQVMSEVRLAILEEYEASQRSSESGVQTSLDFDSFLRSTSEAGGILLPGRGSVDHALVDKIAAEARRPVALVADVLAGIRRLGIDLGSATPIPQSTGAAVAADVSYAERIRAKKNLLERNLLQIAGAITRRDGGKFPDNIKRVKWQVYQAAQIDDYKRADLPDIDRALKIAHDALDTL